MRRPILCNAYLNQIRLRTALEYVTQGDTDLTTVHGAPGTGRAYVFSGRDGARLHVFDAEQPGDGFGVGRAIGDVNGDKYDDLIIAAYTSSAGAPGGGKAYLYWGGMGRCCARSPAPSRTTTWGSTHLRSAMSTATD